MVYLHNTNKTFSLQSQELIERLQTHWLEKKDLTSPEVSLTCAPFRLCLLHDFLANPEMINNIVDDMNTLDWARKKMDLYEFHQTADLASLTWQRSIRGIYELLKTEVMSWVRGTRRSCVKKYSKCSTDNLESLQSLKIFYNLTEFANIQ